MPSRLEKSKVMAHSLAARSRHRFYPKLRRNGAHRENKKPQFGPKYSIVPGRNGLCPGFFSLRPRLWLKSSIFNVLMGPIVLTMALNQPSCISQAAFVQLQLNQPSTINHVGLVGHDLMGVEHVPNKNAHQLGRPFLVPSRLSST